MTATLTGVGTEKELKAALKGKLEELQTGAVEGIKVDGQTVEVKEEDKAKLQKTLGEVNEIKSYLEMFREIRQGLKPDIDTEGVRESVAVSTAVKALMGDGGRELSLGQAFVASDEFKSLQKSRQNTMQSPWDLEAYDLPSLGRKDVYGAMNPGTIQRNFGQIQFDPIVPRGQRRARIRDLFPVATTSANLIDYFQVIGFAENNAATGNNASVSGGSGNAGSVPDYVPASGSTPGQFGLKNKSNLVFRNQQAPVRTIAHWEAAHRNVIDDEPQLQATINNELLYGLALEEDFQILKGSGNGEDLLGIMNAQYIQTYTPGASTELRSDSLRRAATLSILAYYPSTGYVLHPNDWEQIELLKAASGSGGNDQQYALVTNIAIGADTRIWRLPVVESPVIDEGTFLTGAFGTGAQLYDRQQANVRIAEQHGDFFIRNAVAILAEQRLALAMKRPESFVKGLFGTHLVAGFPTDEDSNPAT
jgi:hypothetical protein